jgi:diaminopimelate decarboxylase
MNHFAYRDGVLRCEDVSLETLAAAFGTPLYVYSAATLRRHVRVFRHAFGARDPLIAFAVKANANLAVLRVLAREGAGADTVSAGEIKRALAAGIPADKIIFSGVGKTAEELAFAISVGVRQINVESAAELHLLADIAAANGACPAIALRLNPDVGGAGGHDKIQTGGAGAKFGVSVEDALALYAWAHAHPHLDAVGLAVHIGSQIKDLSLLQAGFAVMRAAAETLRASGAPVSRLDLGGGLGVPYFNETAPPPPSAYAAVVEAVFAGFEAEFAFEPGRLIAANAGVLLSRALRWQTRPDRRILVLDAGLNDLIRPAMYEAYHDIWPVLEPTTTPEPADIVGPVCETGDTFARARPIGAVAAGDLVALMTAGAYGAVMASTYNARALIGEALVDGDRFALVRRPWPVEEQMALEQAPDWLEADTPAFWD